VQVDVLAERKKEVDVGRSIVVDLKPPIPRKRPGKKKTNVKSGYNFLDE
jgi:hypothetical protein